MSSSYSSPHPGIWSAIAGAVRQNRLPCLLLNVVVFALVWSYYQWPSAAGLWQAVADFKVRWSFAFSCLSTALAGAVLPFCIQWAMGVLPVKRRLQRLTGQGLFWGYRGMEIDLFYRWQAMAFGTGNDVGTLALKVAMDQFVYSTLWAVPTYVIALRWIDLDCSWSLTRASLDRHFWTRTYPTILLTNWLVWIPAVALIYSLPAPLQFPLFSVIMCFFVLIVTLLASARQQGGLRPS